MVKYSIYEAENLLSNAKLSLKHKFEIAFEILYLAFAAVAAVVMFYKHDYIFASATLFLLFGDSFHIIPRILRTVRGGYEKALGVGNAVTSVTITIFYVLLYYGVDGGGITAVTIFAVIRIVLCLLPQNEWTSKNPPLSCAVIRNIPFVIIGVMTAVSCFLHSLVAVGVLIIISFLFYLPVVLWAKKNPKIGMLMLPKTAAYIAILAILAF
jgi:hypothetical protein